MLNEEFPLRVEAVPAARTSEWRAEDSFPPRQTQAWSDYTLGGIPSCFLIDCATEKIIAKQLRGEALAQKLSELLD